MRRFSKFMKFILFNRRYRHLQNQRATQRGESLFRDIHGESNDSGRGDRSPRLQLPKHNRSRMQVLRIIVARHKWGGGRVVVVAGVAPL